jgi:hypothetical protein
MMWALAIKSKLTAAVLLGGVLGMVILTNFSERSTNKKINTAVASIYEDRLVVEGYIFEYAQGLRQVEEITEDLSASPDVKRTMIIQKLKEMERLHTLYSKTKLTAEEKTNFNAFTKLCNTISANAERGNYASIQPSTGKARSILNTLSSIQMSEARLQMDNVLKTSSLSNMIGQVETCNPYTYRNHCTDTDI